MTGAMHVHAVRLNREMFDTLLLEPGKCRARGAVATYRGKAWRATGARARPRRAVVMLTGDEAARGRAHAPAGHAVARRGGAPGAGAPAGGSGWRRRVAVGGGHPQGKGAGGPGGARGERAGG